MINPGTILECDQMGPHGKLVVAKIGDGGDWAVYEQAYPDQDTSEGIARYGDKISKEVAEELFPELATSSLRYRP